MKLLVGLCLFGASMFSTFSCSKDFSDNTLIPDPDPDCVSEIAFDQSRGVCSETLSDDPFFTESISGGTRTISSNGIPDHKVGLFGRVKGAINPNAISAQNETYRITLTPSRSGGLTALLSDNGPAWSFGVLINGVEVDPVAAEPFPHEGIFAANVNWEWNLEATNVQIGLDCNTAHVQPTGKYHYHGKPELFLESLNVSSNRMTLIGHAADGFPIYYKYAYSEAYDATSPVKAMTSSYRLKSGYRPGDGETAPCGEYNGIYSNDYEFIAGYGTLDEANGREGVTPEYPNGTYYYMITDEFPAVPRYFVGTPSQDFKLGRQ